MQKYQQNRCSNRKFDVLESFRINNDNFLFFRNIGCDMECFPYIIKTGKSKIMNFGGLEQVKSTQTDINEQSNSVLGPEQKIIGFQSPVSSFQKYENHYQFREQNIIEQALMNLMLSLSYNSICLQNLEEKIQRNEDIISEVSDHVHKLLAKQYFSGTQLLKYQQLQQEDDETFHVDSQSMLSSQPLINQLFGKKTYRYKLQLEGPTPIHFFKERNFNLNVRLVDNNGKKVLNSNIIHLCLGICNMNGDWVIQNSIKEDVLKGRKEVDLYHGEAIFQKLFLREVSRKYPGKKLNFVVYAKQSLVKFVNNSGWQRALKSDQIEPLLIKGISVTSKAKNS